MPLVTTAKTNDQGFTKEEQAELDAAEQEQAAGEAPEIEEAEEQPEPAPQAKPDAPQQPQQQQTEKGKPPPGYVPSGALEEERGRRKELAERMQRMEQTFQQLVLRQQQQPQAPQPNGQAQPGQVPDYDTDPIGHLRAQLGMTLQELNSLKGVTQQTRAEQEAYAQMQQQMATYERHTQDFVRKTPDYGEAANFLRETRQRALSHFMSPQEVQQRIEYEEGLLAGKAMNDGKNPAELFYAMAKEWGYKPKGADQSENKLERLQTGQRASASLGNVKGSGKPAGGSADTMSLEALSELYKTDPIAADRMWDKMAKAGKL
jgi:hypothetical protein